MFTEELKENEYRHVLSNVVNHNKGCDLSTVMWNIFQN